MHHNFGLSPFPLTARRPSSTNKRPVTAVAQADESSDQIAAVADPTTIDETTGGDQ